MPVVAGTGPVCREYMGFVYRPEECEISLYLFIFLTGRKTHNLDKYLHSQSLLMLTLLVAPTWSIILLVVKLPPPDQKYVSVYEDLTANIFLSTPIWNPLISQLSHLTSLEMFTQSFSKA